MGLDKSNVGSHALRVLRLLSLGLQRWLATVVIERPVGLEIGKWSDSAMQVKRSK